MIMYGFIHLNPLICMGSEIDQLYKICCVFGAPEWNTFPEAANISRLVDITYSDVSSCQVCHKNRFLS